MLIYIHFLIKPKNSFKDMEWIWTTINHMEWIWTTINQSTSPNLKHIFIDITNYLHSYYDLIGK